MHCQLTVHRQYHVQERTAAAELFASSEGKKLEAAVAKARSYTPSAAGAGGGEGEGPFTPAQILLIQNALSAASTPDEVDRLHRYLKAGKLPPDLARAAGDQRPDVAEEAEEVVTDGSVAVPVAQAATAASDVPQGGEDEDVELAA